MLDAWKRSSLALPLAVALALLVMGISEWSYARAVAALSELQQRDSGRQELERLLQSVVNAETGQRGYLLTGRKEYLRPYMQSLADIGSTIDALTRRFGDDPSVSPLLQALLQGTGEKLSELATTLQLFEQGRADAWHELMMSNIGMEKMQNVRDAAAALQDIESARIEVQRRRLHDTLLLSRIGVNLMAALAVLALYLFLRQAAAALDVDAAHAAALAAERDRLEREVRARTADLTELARYLQTVREDERARLARELHDELGALLTAAKFDAARMKRDLSAAPGGAERLQHLVQTLNQGIALKRRIIEDLRPSTLNNLGLVPALAIQIREFAERCEVKAHSTLRPVKLAPRVQLTVFRLVQEALTNMTKYASAKQVWIDLVPDGRKVRVTVRDDGVGFDTGAAPPSAHGLLGMRYRVESDGGTLSVRSAPGQGTTIEATLPALDEA